MASSEPEAALPQFPRVPQKKHPKHKNIPRTSGLLSYTTEVYVSHFVMIVPSAESTSDVARIWGAILDAWASTGFRVKVNSGRDPRVWAIRGQDAAQSGGVSRKLCPRFALSIAPVRYPPAISRLAGPRSQYSPTPPHPPLAVDKHAARSATTGRPKATPPARAHSAPTTSTPARSLAPADNRVRYKRYLRPSDSPAPAARQ